jgi:transcriptional regulator with XRE-family HTH domain
MKQHVMNRRYSPLSLAGHGTARTVLLRMAEDQDRATRIAELKERHPRLTWAKIAEQVGVTERAATQWKKTGALKPENAEALAQVFGVDFDYIWSGPRPDTPEMFVDRRSEPSQFAERLASIEDR